MLFRNKLETLVGKEGSFTYGPPDGPFMLFLDGWMPPGDAALGKIVEVGDDYVVVTCRGSDSRLLVPAQQLVVKY